MMSIRAEFLTGRYVAADPYGHDEPEWPPHPGRLFAAMAAAYFEGGKNGGERVALEWLEQCDPPTISYNSAAVFPRETVYHFVPINDKDKYFDPNQVSLGTIDLRGGRLRKERSFPTTITGSPVTFVWDDLDASAHTESLRAICSRVHRLGHSSSIVHLTVDEDAQDVDPTLIPNAHGGQKIRWITPGTLSKFQDAHDVADVKNKQNQPYFARKARLNAIMLPPVSYSAPEDSPRRVPSGQFADMYIFEVSKSPHPSLVHARAISRAVKTRMLASAKDREAVSGLDAAGNPTTKPHISVVPLAAVDHRHADGKVRGIAIVMPRSLDVGSVDTALQALQSDGDNTLADTSGPGNTPAAKLSLDVIGHGPLELAPHEGDGIKTLSPSTWAGMSRTWSSVTPIVLDRAPHARGDARDAEVSRIISKSCTLQGLPSPVSIATSNVPYLPGPPLSSAFPPYTLPMCSGATGSNGFGKKPAENKGAVHVKVHTHAQITFDETVSGPVILGAGRYNGYGLCIPTRGGP